MFKLFNPIKKVLNPKNYLLTCCATRTFLKNWVLRVLKAVTQPRLCLGQDTRKKMEILVCSHWLYITVLHKKDWWQEGVLEGSSSNAHRGEGCRWSRDAEAHNASRQCLAASFQALVPRVLLLLPQRTAWCYHVSSPPAFSVSWASFKKVEVLQHWVTGKLIWKMWEEKQDNVFSLVNIVVIDHNEECVVNQTGRILLKTPSRRALVMVFFILRTWWIFRAFE